MRRRQVVLLVALGIDNLGSGLFLPLALVYAIHVVGVPLGLAGPLVTLGTATGLLVPPLAGRLVDRFGPRTVVSTAQLLQAAGAAGYLVATGPAPLLPAAVCLAVGQQMFYSALFALIADTASAGPRDRAFALVGMVRSATFGLGGLVAGVVLTSVGAAGLRVAVAADGVSFVVAAVLLLTLLRVPHVRHEPTPATVGVLRDRPYLALIGASALLGLALDFFLIGSPVYVLEILHGPAWLPGAMLTGLTLITSTAAAALLRVTRQLARTTSMILGAVLYVAWCAGSLAAAGLPASWRPPVLLAGMVLMSGATMFGSRGNALAEAAAPRELRGRYLAAFQYSFTVAGIVAPGVVALFAVATWLPWLLTAVAAAFGAAGFRYVARVLPRHAVLGEEPVSPVRGTGGASATRTAGTPRGRARHR